MHTLIAPLPDATQPSVVIKTTLYDLIEALNAALQPGKEDLVVPIAMHLLDNSRVTFSRHAAYADHGCRRGQR